ncbi:hypothetical protein [Lysobacter gummosus]|uniref:hypothetical protein n=1 Tax=Lysobacter gummosus TaxID=262324 RepID=UPI0036396782
MSRAARLTSRIRPASAYMPRQAHPMWRQLLRFSQIRLRKRPQSMPNMLEA